MIESPVSPTGFERRTPSSNLDFSNQEANMAELSLVTSFALQGESGLIKLLNSRKLDPQIEILLKAGGKFLNRVAIDTNRYLTGVDPNSEAAKIAYSPIPQIDLYARIRHFVANPRDRDLDRAALAMEHSVYRLRPLLAGLLIGKQKLKGYDLSEYVYLELAYLEVKTTSLSDYHNNWKTVETRGRKKKVKPNSGD